MAAINRTLFAVADDIELAHRCTGRAHGALHGIATTLAKTRYKSSTTTRNLRTVEKLLAG